MEIIAHRGASHDAPENTLAAFRLGYAQQADGCELDIHRTLDGRILVSHDPDTSRTTCVRLRIAEHPLAELQKLDAGSWGPWRGKGFCEHLPALEEVLAIVPRNRKLFIEIKCGPQVLPELRRVVAASGLSPGQISLIGFDLETLREAKLELPDTLGLWLVAADPRTQAVTPPELLIRKARSAGLDGLDLHHGFPIDRPFVEQIHSGGLSLYAWTVDDPAVARSQAAAGVDGITTNRPLWLREQLAP
jgi:glycerophosphoryl diester phosphodiesterase